MNKKKVMTSLIVSLSLIIIVASAVNLYFSYQDKENVQLAPPPIAYVSVKLTVPGDTFPLDKTGGVVIIDANTGKQLVANYLSMDQGYYIFNVPTNYVGPRSVYIYAAGVDNYKSWNGYPCRFDIYSGQSIKRIINMQPGSGTYDCIKEPVINALLFGYGNSLVPLNRLNSLKPKIEDKFYEATKGMVVLKIDKVISTDLPVGDSPLDFIIENPDVYREYLKRTDIPSNYDYKIMDTSDGSRVWDNIASVTYSSPLTWLSSINKQRVWFEYSLSSGQRNIQNFLKAIFSKVKSSNTNPDNFDLLIVIGEPSEGGIPAFHSNNYKLIYVNNPKIAGWFLPSFTLFDASYYQELTDDKIVENIIHETGHHMGIKDYCKNLFPFNCRSCVIKDDLMSYCKDLTVSSYNSCTQDLIKEWVRLRPNGDQMGRTYLTCETTKEIDSCTDNDVCE
ncbi:hypothetical protein HYW74_01625 [Candidatus Pacearchaeota archaeon]|nr:hypothetical protein [Candidatus Pacearchaeota archaeon]